MLRSRVSAVCLALATTLLTGGVRAQYCDPRYDGGCPDYRRPSPVFPWAQPAPVPPRVPAPGPTYAPSFPQGVYGGSGTYQAIYGPVYGEPFPIPAVRLTDIGSQFLRAEVLYRTSERPGTIIIDPGNHFLYFVEGGGRAIRYGVGVGREGFGWSGIAAIHDKQEWPDWYPPKEMIARQPELRQQLDDLQGGLGMPGGPRNPLGSRAMYLWQGDKDTLYRIHGTVEPWTIGKSVSSGCIRMINQDVIDLYMRAAVGAKVIVLAAEG
ncbi:MAG TPA: L,D-transpeptidase [Xanthobacteraceae bacterium]|jgi:lipoprotein-anchoring transpeptidase ErfK/SrfK|nr:L,D-transpeptidase [Xanthobacteraceae bacterium]